MTDQQLQNLQDESRRRHKQKERKKLIAKGSRRRKKIDWDKIKHFARTGRTLTK